MVLQQIQQHCVSETVASEVAVLAAAWEETQHALAAAVVEEEELPVVVAVVAEEELVALEQTLH